MKVTKPNWVEHGDEKQARSPVYSLSVHPDGTRLATGGQDNQVKIWSTLPILDPSAEEDAANPRLLCTMSAHTGPVLTVRWAHHGRYLASGSDDGVVLIWDIDPNGGGRVFGSTEVNVENWKALRRLVGHVADVVDCAWSRDDAMLASVGLDSKIIIWDGHTFERLRTLDAHQGFVKGVTWDPVGNYLATQSDDKTVRIWNTDDWKCVQTVSKPFELSPQSTFFRRLSWSPDGAFIAASNAMNGPVFVAAVIDREGWMSEISFVGHENTIQVTAFNPRLFFSKDKPQDRVNASCMLALGADDFNISIWRNTHHKPLVVVRDIFSRQLLDLCWANDGLTLYGCSADGSICAIQFRPDEFPELGDAHMTDKILDDYGYKSQRHRPIVLQPPREISVTTSFGVNTGGGSEHVNVIIPRKAPKKAHRRIGLSGMMGSGSGSNAHSANGASSGGRAPLQRPVATPDHPRGGAVDAFAFAADQPLSDSPAGTATARMFNHMEREPTLKRKASNDDFDRPKGRTMGRESRNLGPVQEIRAPRVAIAGSSVGGGSSGPLLPVPSIQSVLRVQQDDGHGVFTAENSTDGGNTTVALAVNGKESWVDFIPSPALAIVANSSLCAVATEDGMVRVFSPIGRHVSSFKLPAPASEVAAAKEFLMVVTADSMVRVMDTRRGKTTLPPTSIAHLLNPPSSSANPAPSADVTAAMVRPNGVAVVLTSEPAAWAYDADVAGWTQIATPWWGASPLNEVRTRGRGSHAQPNGPLADIEARVSAAAAGDTEAPVTKPQWWDEAMSMGHYETRLRASVLLDSKDEYKHWLREYSKYLAQEGFRERAEELITELVGPVFHLGATPSWAPTMMGVPKRDFAGIALGVMKASPALGGFAGDQIAVLKRIREEEARWA